MIGLKKKISEKEVDFIAGNVVATLKFEGMDTTKEEIEELKEMLRGNVSYEKCVKKIIEGN